MRVRLGLAGALLCLLGLIGPVGATPSIQAGPAAEIEPNDDFAAATPFDAVSGAKGSFPAATEWDYYRFAADDDFAAGRWTLQLQIPGDGVRRLCLLDGTGTELQCREGAAPSLPDLALAPGDYGVSLTNRDKSPGDYALSFEQTGEPSPDEEAEPDDTRATASHISEKRAIRGHFAGSEDDFYRFTVEGEPQLWRVQAQGEGIESLAYVEPDGGEPISQPARGEKRVRLDDLYLLPGKHTLRLRGTDGAYTVRLLPVGPPPVAPLPAAGTTGGDGPLIPVTEREPNNDASRAARLRFGEPQSGRLSNPDDRDLFRFSLAAPEHIRLTVSPPPDGQVQVDLANAFSNATRPPGELVALETVLGPGDFLVNLDAGKTSDLPYTILLERLDPFDLPADLEPFNNDRAAAPPLPPGLAVTGYVNSSEDWVDWYRLPDASAATELALSITGGPGVELRAGDSTLYPTRQDPATGGAVYSVPAATPLTAGVSGDGAYALTASFADGPGVAPAPPTPPLAMTLSGGEGPAAFVEAGQRLELTVALINTGTAALPLALAATTSDLAWSPALRDEIAPLAPGETRRIPLTVTLPADVPADQPVRITVRAQTDDGAGVSAFTEIAAVCAAPAVNPDPAWSTAGPLAGGLNVAWSGLGGRPMDDSGGDAAALNDGRVSPATGYRAPIGSAVTVDLAGDAAWPIAGVLLNPQGRQDSTETLRKFEVALSQDGVTFTPALRGELSPAPFEQAFALPAPVIARFARLTLLSAAGGGDRAGLGEWKVVAQPGVAQPDTATESDPLNLLDPAAGGHIVFASPLLADMQALLTEKEEAPVVRTERDGGAVWTARFHDARAAQITALAWRNAAASDPAQRLRTVQISYSLDSPVGPWQPLADWKLDSASTVTQTLELAAPTWVRFLRFEVPPAAQPRGLALPDRLAALERPSGDGGYRSALAEWGQDRRHAFYERFLAEKATPGAPQAGGSELEPNDQRATARPLPPGEIANGTVQTGLDEDWYRVTIPEGIRRLDLTLATGAPGSVAFELLDANGETVPYTTQDPAGGPEPSAVTHMAAVEPGEYLLRLSQPRHSVAFAWDTSGSVAPYLPVIYPALATFAAGLDPQQSAVNLLPFAEQPRFLLQEFSSAPETVLRALQSYGRADASSNAEVTLAVASEALGRQAGRRAVVLITDADSGGYAETERLWRALEQTRPQIFAFQTSFSGLAHSQDLMQDWASVGEGYYTQAATVLALETGFARATCALRGPAAYVARVAFGAEPPPPPEPGSIAVSAPDARSADAPVGSAAVEIILDTSGSMLQRIGNQRRIDIAKNVLNSVTSEVLPAGTPLALRAFGHREAGSCRTDLEIPLGPLDPAAAKKVIAGLQAKNGAKTPIAASLRLTSDDLAAATGPRLVILLTDGEETCGGDPAAELRRLRELGLDVRMNIVGFGVDDAKTEKLFRDWAALAGGQYLPARDAGELRTAVAAALRAPFRILNAAGETIAQGTLGGPAVQTPPGTYTVEVLTSPTRRFEGVTVAPGEAVTLTY